MLTKNKMFFIIKVIIAKLITYETVTSIIHYPNWRWFCSYKLFGLFFSQQSNPPLDKDYVMPLVMWP